MHVRLFAVIAITGSLFGCDVDFDVDKIVDRAAIRAAKRKWQEKEIHDYVFVYREQCNCFKPDLTGIRVEVKDDKAVSAVGAQNGIPVPAQAATVDDLFDNVLERSEAGADRFDVEFDKERNFIEQVLLDPDEAAQDDEYGFHIPCFSNEDKLCAFPLITAEECGESNGSVTPIPEKDPAKVCGDDPERSTFGQVERDVSVCCVQ
jgi:hypothetical protein